MLKRIQNSMNRIKNSNRAIFHLAAFGLIYLLWNCSTFLHHKSAIPVLDFSWLIGLNWASLLNFKWLGDNVVFTYGPLYYLDGLLLPEFHSKSTIILTVIGLNLFYAACFTYIYSCFVNLRFEQKRKRIALIIVAIFLLFQGPDLNLVPLFTAFIFLPIIFSADENTKRARIERYVRYGIIILLLAVIPFIKLSHIYESLMFIVIMMGVSIYKRKYLEAAIIGFLFSVFTILIWVLTTGETSLSLLPAYFVSRLSISSGYTEAMMINFRGENGPRIFIFALFFFISLISGFVYLLFAKKWIWAVVWLFPIISLFLGFKNSFVRAEDAHARIFLDYIILSVLYYFYLLKQMNVDAEKEPGRSSSRVALMTRVMVPVLAIILFSIFPLGAKVSPSGQFSNILQIFAPESYSTIDQQNIAAKYKTGYKKYFHLDNAFLGHIDPKKTIDIIPWDIALLYTYDLRWTPRPILQSYAAYTSLLDALDADFFRKPDSPSQLIFSLSEIGLHSPVFSNPNTFRALLDNYQPVTRTTNNQYMLLEKKKAPLSRDLILLTQNNFHLNEDIAIPNIKQGHVFMAAKIEHTLFGKFLDIVYKPSFLFVEITLNTGQKIKYRLIRDTAQNGLFVSKYIKTMNDLQSVLNETYRPNIASIRFTGDTKVYSDSIRVNFYKIPFQP